MELLIFLDNLDKSGIPRQRGEKPEYLGEKSWDFSCRGKFVRSQQLLARLFYILGEE